MDAYNVSGSKNKSRGHFLQKLALKLVAHSDGASFGGNRAAQSRRWAQVDIIPNGADHHWKVSQPINFANYVRQVFHSLGLLGAPCCT
jgi:hypothetical protein